MLLLVGERPPNCKAVRDRTGGYACAHCGMQWDADDDDPPECRRESGKASETTHRRELGRIRNILSED